MNIYTGNTALITGASAGIGEAFAHSLARRRMNLVLVARSAGKLTRLAAVLSERYQVQVAVLAADLIQPGAALQLFEATIALGLRVDLLVNSAGFGSFGPFEDIPAEQEYQQIILNNAALVDMTHAFVPPMLERGQGGIINLASMVGFQPDPYMAVYGATKAFVLSFSEALWAEYKPRGVRVLALCPGAVETSFLKKLGDDDITKSSPIFARPDTPEHVAEVGLRALERGRCYAVNGFSNYWLAQTSRFFPRAWVARFNARMVTRRPSSRSPSR